MNEDTRIILEELKGMRSDISEMKTDISELKSDVKTFKLKTENEIYPAIKVISENQDSLHKKMDYLLDEFTQIQIDMLKMRVSNLEAKTV